MPRHLFPFVNPFQEEAMPESKIPLFNLEELKKSGGEFLKNAPEAAKAELEKAVVENRELVAELGADFLDVLFKHDVISAMMPLPSVREGMTLQQIEHWSKLDAAQAALGAIITEKSADKAERVAKLRTAIGGAAKKTAGIILGMGVTAVLGA